MLVANKPLTFWGSSQALKKRLWESWLFPNTFQFLLVWWKCPSGFIRFQFSACLELSLSICHCVSYIVSSFIFQSGLLSVLTHPKEFVDLSPFMLPNIIVSFPAILACCRILHPVCEITLNMNRWRKWLFALNGILYNWKWLLLNANQKYMWYTHSNV